MLRFFIASLLLVSATAFAKVTPQIVMQDKPSVLVTADKPDFTIKLKSNPTTGYSWFLKQYDQNFIEVVSHKYAAPEDKKMMGAPGYDLWNFKMKPAAFNVPHEFTIKLVYARPWENKDEGSEVVFKVSTQEKGA